MEELKTIFSIISAVLGFIVAVITVFLKFIKKAKNKKTAQITLEVVEKLVEIVDETKDVLQLDTKDLNDYLVSKIKLYIQESQIEYTDEQIELTVKEYISVLTKEEEEKNE